MAPVLDVVDYRDSAFRFSLMIIETYFTRDSALFRSYLADTLYTLENAPPFLRDSLKLDKIFSATHDYSMYTLTGYLETYSPASPYLCGALNHTPFSPLTKRAAGGLVVLFCIVG